MDTEEVSSSSSVEDDDDTDFKLSKSTSKRATKKKAAKRKSSKKGKSAKKEAPKKKRAPKKKTPTKRPVLQKGSSQIKLLRSNSILKLERGLSISDFYTEFAGMHDEIIAERDTHSNPSGRQYDLGKEGAFGKFSILVGLFCWDLKEAAFMENSGKALHDKGFRVICTLSEDEFIEGLATADVAWVVSSEKVPGNPAFVDACVKFQQSGKGLALWADNEPYVATVNAILAKLVPTLKIAGNTPGNNTLSVSDEGKKKGEFRKHIITSGIANLFEGITLGFPSGNLSTSVFSSLATSSDNHPCILYADYNTGLPTHEGRILLDCGFTKLYHNFDTAGTARYIRNVCVWLLAIDHRLAIGAELQGEIPQTLAKKAHHTQEKKKKNNESF